MIRHTPCAFAACLLPLCLLLSAGCKSSPSSGPGYSTGAVEACSAVDLSGPPTMNAMYAARNPRVCAKVMTPPNAAQAAALVQCSAESDSTGGSTPMLTLTTEVQAEVGAARAYIAGTDDATEIDPRAMVYPLRGGGTLWQCLPPEGHPAGQNCLSYPRNNTTSLGRCYKTTFGDYQCLMPVGGPKQVPNLAGPATY